MVWMCLQPHHDLLLALGKRERRITNVKELVRSAVAKRLSFQGGRQKYATRCRSSNVLRRVQTPPVPPSRRNALPSALVLAPSGIRQETVSLDTQKVGPRNVLPVLEHARQQPNRRKCRGPCYQSSRCFHLGRREASIECFSPARLSSQELWSSTAPLLRRYPHHHLIPP